MPKPINFSQFKWKVAYLDVGQFLELDVGLRNGRVGLEFQGYPVPVNNKPINLFCIALLHLISKIIITFLRTD